MIKLIKSTWTQWPVKISWSLSFCFCCSLESLFPPYVHEVSEGSIAEYSCFTTAQNKFLTAKLPSSAAQGQLNHKPECRMRTQRVPYLRSKIKVRWQFLWFKTAALAHLIMLVWIFCAVAGYDIIVLPFSDNYR